MSCAWRRLIEQTLIKVVNSDKVTFLSVDEANNLSEKNRIADPTEFVSIKMAKSKTSNNGIWWLRSPGG